ncbi:FAS1-like dehydratase domain-containing protein [Acrocarpospora macrocephala]
MDLRREGVIDPHAGRALAGLLGVEAVAAGEPGGSLPPMWHWVQLLDEWRQDELGPDGHPLAGQPGPGRTRMFAGGRTRHLRPLRVGETAMRSSGVVASVDKTGRSGPLTFVTVRHEFRQGGELAITEEQDIVYQPPGVLPTTDGGLPMGEPRFVFDVDPVVLFRFSALTYNAHRIHYDHRFAAAEGYADLVVHGPLLIVLMAELFRRYGAGFGWTGIPISAAGARPRAAATDRGHGRARRGRGL